MSSACKILYTVYDNLRVFSHVLYTGLTKFNLFLEQILLTVPLTILGEQYEEYSC